MIWSLSKGWDSCDSQRDGDGDGGDSGDGSNGSDGGGGSKSVPAGNGPLANNTPANDDSVTSVAIPVTVPAIEYEEKDVGYGEREPGTPPMQSPDGDTVLRLAFYLTY